MKLIIVTKDDGPESRSALELGDRLSAEDYLVEKVDFNESNSESAIALYDIYNTPAMIVAEDDGRLVEIWQGELPLESEIKNLLRL